MTLNEYARVERPVRQGRPREHRREVASVVRASDSSFQVRWQEQTFEGGALKDTKRLTASSPS